MKQCYFCTNNLKEIDYKNTEVLGRFLDSYARILSHKKGNVCTGHSRKLSQAIKRARFLGLLPFITR